MHRIKLVLMKYTGTKVLTSFFFTSTKTFLKNRKRSETSLTASFFANYLKKNIFPLNDRI